MIVSSEHRTRQLDRSRRRSPDGQRGARSLAFLRATPDVPGGAATGDILSASLRRVSDCSSRRARRRGDTTLPLARRVNAEPHPDGLGRRGTVRRHDLGCLTRVVRNLLSEGALLVAPPQWPAASSRRPPILGGRSEHWISGPAVRAVQGPRRVRIPAGVLVLIARRLPQFPNCDHPNLSTGAERYYS